MATIRKRTLPSGKTKWLAAYIDGGGKRRFKQFDTRKEADAFMTRARSEVASGVHVPESQSMTVGRAADEWLRTAEEAGLERSTLVHYRAHVNEHIRPMIGGLKLSLVTTPRVYAFADELKAAGRSAETVRRSIQSLGRIFRYAKGRGLAGQNPVADVKLRRSKRETGRVEIPTREDLKAILAQAEGRWRPLIVTAMFTGLRISELRGLRWSDIDLKRRLLTVADLNPAEIAQARQAMLRAGIEAAEALRARYEGDFNFEPRDRLLTMELATSVSEPPPPPVAPTTATKHGPVGDQHEVYPLSTVGTAFRTTQVATGAWDRQTAAQAGATFRLFIDVCGDQPLAGYTRKDAGRFRNQIERLPNDYGKHPRYRDFTVERILTAFEALPAENRAPVITQKTVKRHFSALSALWTAAVARDEAAANIFTGFRFSTSRKVSEQRDMWERAELVDLFATPIWIGCASPTRRTTPGSFIIRDEKFWLPLIAVFSGMRLEEICQLHIEDIRQDEEVWFIDISDRPPRKLKNATAVRRVPIHSELIRLGFLAYVDKMRRIRQPRVFPALEPGGSDARLGHAFTKWFTRYRRDVELYRPGLDFHSFRHTATTLMHQSGVAVAVIDHITGHATAGETARYTKRSSLPQMKAAIDTINIGVDLSALYDKGQSAA